MKQVTTLFIVILLGKSCLSQNTEFGKSGNGLIYSDTTIKQLKFIVDSLNLKFKVCDLTRVYESKLQGKANYVWLEKDRVKEAKKDIEEHIAFGDFIKKYPKANIEKDLLVVRFKYKDSEKKDVVEFSSIELGGKYEHTFSYDKELGNYDKPMKGKWIYDYNKKTTYSAESIVAFFFTEELTEQPLPDMYARMVQYSECMVDTSAQVFYEKAHEGGVMYSREEPAKVTSFMSYVDKMTSKPEPQYDDKNYEVYRKKYDLWDSLRIARVDSLKNNDSKFNTLFTDAVKEAIVKGGTDNAFEEYVGRYYSKKTELELKRNRIVIGGCSMDNSPRVHALNIARLSAETVNWEIFLRSHLDIMNDRFQRVSDGSYAWGQRKTYIKELEVLDIDVLDLLLGISLRVENPSTNHYYGSIGRLGRALSETKSSVMIESKMLQMISDARLDDYNRILIYYLFLSYNYNLEDKDKQAANKERLKTAVKWLPDYIASKIAEGKEE